MDKKSQKNFLLALETILEQRELQKEELQEYIQDVFKKTFSKDYHLIPYEYRDSKYEIEDSEVIVNVDFDNFIFEVKRKWIINNDEISPENMLKEISTSSELVTDKTLENGQEYIEEIDLSNISNSKRQQIHQLLIQRSKETAKEKIFNKYKNLIGKVIVARIFKVEQNYALLKYDDEVIFLPEKEMLPTDMLENKMHLKILILDVNKTSKDSQIVASRTRPQFVSELIASENELVARGDIKIERIVREPGVKTKVAVSTKIQNIDPVGSIIGVKGSKIKPVISEINGEIIDVVEYSEDEDIFITNLFYPARIKGIYFKTIDENSREIFVLVNDHEFLQAIGKRGINVKLVARIVGAKIDVISESKSQNYDFEFKMLEPRRSFNFRNQNNNNNSGHYNNYNNNNNNNRNNQYNNNNNFVLKIKTLEEIIEEGNRLEEDDDDFDS